MTRMNLAEVAPAGYRAVLALEQYVRGAVDRSTLDLVKLRASILNGCAFCVDMHSTDALAAGESSRRLFAVAAWREAPFFTEAERAALALTDAVTRLGEHGVPDDVWAAAEKHWAAEGTANLILAIATINVWNRVAVSTRMPPPPEPAPAGHPTPADQPAPADRSTAAGRPAAD
ncbi:hypothetical protein GCM10010123_36060 [Pilimelia anulata]|uniref:Carboxymuconolactone decarboxylase-like domain-containing protein n=1 Tax=Pilimelia anulata TaxID=53371 RepID=A0A8J3BF39_9ACTN|nr:carboxymuconolactone decarboxylase family protein [Pilimelia anulata]GGK02863.1 hypothetical protein GCM10010123_36060 [Pilimelia anulata]